MIAEFVRNDKAVQLSVVLEHTSAVTADDFAVAVNYRIGAHPAFVVQHHRRMPDNDPLVKAVSLFHEIIAAYKVVYRMLVQPLSGIDRSVGKDEIFRFYGVRERRYEPPLVLKAHEKLFLAVGEAVDIERVNAAFVAHIP